MYAINTLLGYPYFRCREQVVRLMRKRGYSNEVRALQNKANAGIRLTIFEDTFALHQRDDGLWENFRLHLRWEIKEDYSGDINWQGQFMRDKLIELFKEGKYADSEIDRFILTGTQLNGKSHAHAVVLQKDIKGTTVRIYDSGVKYVQRSKGSTDHYFNIDIFLAINQVVRLYELQCRIKATPENLSQIKGIMTGQVHSITDYNEQRKQEKAEGVLKKQRRRKGKASTLEPRRKMIKTQ